MAVSRLDVRTADGVMDVGLHVPDGGNPAPAVIMYPDAGGVRDVLRDMAARVVSAGYVVALPNIFYRSGEFAPFTMATVFSDPEERARLMKILAQAPPAAVMEDTGALLDALAGQPAVRPGPVCAVGYCVGGRMAFTAAGAHPTRIAAAASIHGGGIATEDPSSPHLQAGRIRASLYFAISANDRSCTEEDQARLVAALDAAKVDYEIEQFTAAHGFAMADFAMYDEAACERQWEKVLALFARALPVSV